LGVLPEQEKINFLIEKDLWDAKNEKRISFLEDNLDRQRLTLSKLVAKSQKATVQSEIEKLQTELNTIKLERSQLLGDTCESYAQKKSNEALLKYCFFKDEDLKERYYTDEDYEDIEYSEINTLYLLMSKTFEKFTDNNIKIICLMPFFLNSFFISGDSPFYFFGKPTYELTSYQLDLYSNGLSVKNNLTEKNPIPKDILKNPEIALSWFNFSENKALKDSKDKDGLSIAGATIEEMKAVDPNAVSLQEQAKKMFGEEKRQLNMQDMMKLHGL
jgi:hypothetical protein